jgi:hypothetical protein
LVSVGAIPVDARNFDFYTVTGQRWLCGPERDRAHEPHWRSFERHLLRCRPCTRGGPFDRREAVPRDVALDDELRDYATLVSKCGTTIADRYWRVERIDVGKPSVRNWSKWHKGVVEGNCSPAQQKGRPKRGEYESPPSKLPEDRGDQEKLGRGERADAEHDERGERDADGDPEG